MLEEDVVQIIPKQAKPRIMLLDWLRTWELYIIVLIAGFLRFYQLNTTEFDQDQAILFRMARDAFTHGLLPTTSNTASIGIAHPAGVIYLFILPALLNPDPLGGTILVALCAMIAVVLTYFFTRRYYGRLAGTIAALLYATAFKPLIYARFIWQPNLMPPFVLLFFFALYYGVVERRKGWLFPALVLLGILYQMHEIAVLLAIPFVVALLLSPHTFRWRDIVFASIGLIIIFFPYLLWQDYTHFTDLHTILTLARQHSRIDGQALQFYQIFLTPNKPLATDPHMLPYALTPLYSWLQYAMPTLVVLGLLSLVFALVAPRMWGQEDAPHTGRQGHPQGDAPPIRREGSGSGFVYGRGIPLRVPLRQLHHSLRSLQSDRNRCGIIVLLVWQVAPLLILSRHAIDLHTQYFFMLLPGPFVLIGIFFGHTVNWLRRQHGWLHQTRIALYSLAFLLVATQTLGSTAWILDTTHGNISNDTFTPYHNDLLSLKQALNDADSLAQAQHLNHVYVTVDEATQTALGYLSEEMHTPTTLFDASRCLVLPGAVNGPAVLLVGPHDALTDALVKQFANATLVSMPTRLGGTPFHLYLVSTQPVQTTANKDLFFGNDLQLAERSAQKLVVAQKLWMVTRWNFLHPQTAHLRTNYGYVLMATSNSNPVRQTTNVCTFSTIRAGDQLLVAFSQPKSSTTATSMSIEAKSFMQIPFNPTYGIFHMETDTTHDTPWLGLQTAKGNHTISVGV